MQIKSHLNFSCFLESVVCSLVILKLLDYNWKYFVFMKKKFVATEHFYILQNILSSRKSLGMHFHLKGSCFLLPMKLVEFAS